MPYISRPLFWRTLAAGLVATFVMAMTGFWQSGIGLPAYDTGAILARNMTAAHPEAPYTLFAGNLAYFANGVLLAFIWVAFLRRYVPGNWLTQGAIFGAGLALTAALIMLPLVARTGVFFIATSAPFAMLLATAAVHLAYGLALTLSLELAGVGEATMLEEEETKVEVSAIRARHTA